MKYTKNGNEIYSEKGKLVATLDADGNPVFAQGMAGAHYAGVHAFLAEQPKTAPDAPPPMPEIEEADGAPETEKPEPATAEVKPESEGMTFYGPNASALPKAKAVKTAEAPATDAARIVADIPDAALPPWDPEHGKDTPGFRDWVKFHKMTPEQVFYLVRRLENRRK